MNHVVPDLCAPIPSQSGPRVKDASYVTLGKDPNRCLRGPCRWLRPPDNRDLEDDASRLTGVPPQYRPSLSSEEGTSISNHEVPGKKASRKRWPLALSSLIFVAAAWYAFTGVDIPLAEVRWWAVVVLVVLAVPMTTLLNGEEFRTIGAMLGYRFARVTGLEVAILGSAANILPIPGAVLIRVRAMRAVGATYGRTTTAIGIAGAAWAGAAAFVAGLLLAVTGQPLIGTLGAGAGALLWIGTYFMLRWRLPESGQWGTWGRLLAVETASVLVGAVRYVLVLVAVGEPVTIGQAAALTVAGVVATATGIFPGGLGLREALAALIGPIVSLPARSALFAAVGNRIAEYVFLGPAALVVTRLVDGSVLTSPPSAATSEIPADQ